ncbi:hypothetical protein [Sorangium sp. So ce124]|uniref:hypothetical protein n=1 Tax=Sorangium sp. So ce124 TaxID=3133280 RepID=UPI003F6108B6
MMPPVITDFSLDSSYPMVLLPVRVETRFGPDQLRVRIYPDEIFADTHEPALTDAELADGQQYWVDVWRRSEDDRKTAWRRLLQRNRAQRAAWIVRATQPTNLASMATDAEPRPPSAVAMRSSSWTRGARATLLPDRWTVIAYRAGRTGGALRVQTSALPAAGLSLSTGPNPRMSDLAYQLQYDAASLWTLDYDEAVKAGMAVTIDKAAGLLDEDLRLGFDRVVVLGVKTSATGEKELAALLDAHHYTGGLALLPQGTPTNNTGRVSSAFPAADPNGEMSYAVERSASLLRPGSDGTRLEQALGLSARADGSRVFDHIQGAGRDELSSARAMAQALFPATLGYFMEQLGAPVFTEQQYKDVRSYFVDNVQGRGQLPIFRVGRVPYGVLPVTNVPSFKPSGSTDLEKALPGTLDTMARSWMTAAGYVGFGVSATGEAAVNNSDYIGEAAGFPRISRRSTDPVSDLHRVVAREASSTAFRVSKGFVGPSVMRNFAHFLNGSAFFDASVSNDRIGAPVTLTPRDDTTNIKKLFSNWVLAAEDLYKGTSTTQSPWPSSWSEARIAWTQQTGGTYAFNGPLVGDLSSETEGLDDPKVNASFGFNYIAWLETADPEAIRDRKAPVPAGKSAPTALLFELLRRSALNMYLRLAYEATGDTAPRFDSELLVLDGNSRWDRFSAKTGVPAGSAYASLGKYLASSDYDASGTTERAAFRAALGVLKALPSAELERLFTETLDVCSHRLDAWINSLSTTRLSELRKSKPTGCWVGGYAWVEDLRPLARTYVSGVKDKNKDGTDATVTIESAPATSGGFVLTPSLNHATTAAVLLNAPRTHPVDPDMYTVNLSSYRVRQGRFILDAVRNGQPLGAVLGYLFERWMHEYSRRTPASADAEVTDITPYISDLRKRFPLTTVGRTVAPADASVSPTFAAESIDARNVADGLSIYNHKKEFDEFAHSYVSPTSTAGRDIEEALKIIYIQLADCVDGLSDLLLAESVFQATRGNTGAASASLEGMAQGLRPPDPDFIRTPAAGASITHRALWVLVDEGGAPLKLHRNWPDAATPRAAAEPAIDGWVGSLLGDPAQIGCRVVIPASGSGGGGAASAGVTLQDLGLRPIDFLSLARAASLGEADSELDGRVLDAARAKLGMASLESAQILYGSPGPGVSRSFHEMLELGAAIHGVLGQSRALSPSDLAPPVKAKAAGQIDAGNAVERATAARRGLVELALASTIADVVAKRKSDDDLRAVLRSAALYGLQGAYPPPAGTISSRDLLAAAQAVQKEIESRTGEGESSITDAAGAGKVLSEVFGRDFIWLPRFTLHTDAADELGNALSGSVSFGGDSELIAVNRWFNGAALVRPALGRWRKLRLYTRALSKAGNGWKVAQLPYKSGETWVGAKLSDPMAYRGKVSLVLQCAGSPPKATDRLAGLYVDEWNELIPSSKRTAGVAFQYDNPGAEAPQAILCAVPADAKKKWDINELAAVINVAMDLARIRAVTLSETAHLPNYLPWLYYPVNAEHPATQDTLHPQLTRIPSL